MQTGEARVRWFRVRAPSAGRDRETRATTTFLRYVVVFAGLLPYLYYGIRDQLFHFRGRRVGAIEHLLHLAIGICIFLVVAGALQARMGPLLVALALFCCAGGLDEYVFHRGIPAEESDLHAKAHMALLGFIVVVLLTSWLGAGAAHAS